MANSILNPMAARGLSKSPGTMNRMGLSSQQQQNVGKIAQNPTYSNAVKLWTNSGGGGQQKAPAALTFQDFMGQQGSYFDPFQGAGPLQTFTPGGEDFGQSPIQAKVKQKPENPLLKMLRTV